MPSFYQSLFWCIMLLSVIWSSLVLNLLKLLFSPSQSCGSCPSQTLHPSWGSACLGRGLCSVGSAAGAALWLCSVALFCITASPLAGALFLSRGPPEVSVLHAVLFRSPEIMLLVLQEMQWLAMLC